MTYTKTGKKVFGVSVPLGAIKTDGGWYIGEYPDLVNFGVMCNKIGAELIQVLPLNDTGSQSSPYSAISAFALHPLYIRVSDIKLVNQDDSVLQKLSSHSNKTDRFNYQHVLKIKLEALKTIYDKNKTAIMKSPELKDYVSKNTWLKTYAVYKRLKTINNEQTWKHWPEYSSASNAEIQALWDDEKILHEHYFYVWLQYEASNQFLQAALKLKSLGIELLGDIPILMNADSADVWANRNFFITDMQAGAPPDMYSTNGQNWGFPLYNWNSIKDDNYNFWKQRLISAANYYSAFRIDHVLGFFRIWAMNKYEETGRLGRFIPGAIIKHSELSKLGFSDERIRWLSLSHVPSPDAESKTALNQISNEDLYLFKPSIKGEKDIEALDISIESKAFLKEQWSDRAIIPIENNSYSPYWFMQDSKAWKSLSSDEKQALSALIDKKQKAITKQWEQQGEELLLMLKSATDMLPCAEDLGAVPTCVPKVLKKHEILGLRIPRWMKEWNKPNQPSIPLNKYEPLSICAPSVHDTSTLREWLEYEENIDTYISIEQYKQLLASYSKCPSLLFITQIQDIIDLSDELRSDDPRTDRINIPGTVNDFNWTWLMQQSVESLIANREWVETVINTCKRN